MSHLLHSEESNAPRVRCSRQRRREGAAGWWPTSPNCRWAGRRITPASWPPTTNSTCPATASPQAGGTAPAPTAWGWRAKHRRPGSRPCSRAGTRRRGSCSAAPMAATPSRRSMWSCARPRASRSSTAWVTRPPAGRCWPPITPGWPRRSPTWTSTWGPAAATAVQARVRTGAAGGRVRPPDIQRRRPAAAHPSGRGQPGPGAGRTLDGLGRPGPVSASAGCGRHLPGHLPAGTVRTLGVEWTPADTHGNRELQGMPEELVREFSKRTDQIDAELDRLVADGRERTPRLVKWAVQATRNPSSTRRRTPCIRRWRQEAAERGGPDTPLVRRRTRGRQTA